MSKKTIYILISALLSILILGIIGYYLYLKNTSGETPSTPSGIFSGFFPFGGDDPNSNNSPEPEETPDTDVPVEQPSDYIKKLRKISSEPVAGAGILSVKAGDIVRYIEKSTGHIYEVEMFSPRQGRISNTTIPQVYDSVFGNSNNSLVARYLKDDNMTVDTYSLNIKEVSTTTENTITGLALPSNIDDVSVLGNSIFFLQKNNSGSTGFITNFTLGTKKQVWNSPIKDLISQYPNSKTIVLTTKPDEGSLGYMYYVDTNTGSYKKVLGDIYGLSALVSWDASKAIYLDQGSVAGLFVFDTKSEQKQNISPVTFPEKCVWSKKDTNIVYCAVPTDNIFSGTLIDWYKGLIQTEDNIWKYDLKSNVSSIVMNFKNETSEAIDVIKPILSEDEQYLLFINKRDNSLWSLDLTK